MTRREPCDGFPRIFRRETQIALKLGSSVRTDASKGKIVVMTRIQIFYVLYRLPGVLAQRPPEVGTECLK